LKNFLIVENIFLYKYKIWRPKSSTLSELRDKIPTISTHDSLCQKLALTIGKLQYPAPKLVM